MTHFMPNIALTVAVATMLARAGLGDDARLAHPFREKDLPHRVVDLVRAGVEQVFTLEINLRPGKFAVSRSAK